MTLALLFPAILFADGGTLRASGRCGDSQVSVFTSPAAPRCGIIDISVLTQEALTGKVHIEVPATIKLTKIDTDNKTQPIALEQITTTSAATNKLFRAAQFNVPEAGPWHVTVALNDPSMRSASQDTQPLQFDLVVSPPPAPWLSLAPWIGWPFGVVLLFFAHQRLASSALREEICAGSTGNSFLRNGNTHAGSNFPHAAHIASKLPSVQNINHGVHRGIRHIRNRYPARAQRGPRGPAAYLNRSPDWFAGDEAKQIADNILSYQADAGGWPKNVNTTAKLYTGERDKLEPTFDNSATTDELRYLAHIYQATHDEKYRAAVFKGIDYILKAQYPNGGWPQFCPPHPETPYQRYITFNDDAMVRLMNFVRETYTDKLFDFVDADRRQVAIAFNKGINCILKCQIKVDGKLTVWCAARRSRFQPTPRGTYELISLSGSESVGIVRLLMSLDQPSPEVKQAIDAAIAWFKAAQLTNIRVERRPDDKAPRGFNKVVVKDSSAPPIWARFYEIGANRPIFSDRDGIAKHDLAEIGYERRNGYNWLDYWPQQLLKTEYPAWQAKWEPDARPSSAN